MIIAPGVRHVRWCGNGLACRALVPDIAKGPSAPNPLSCNFSFGCRTNTTIASASNIAAVRSIKESRDKKGKGMQYFGMEWFKGRKPTETNAQLIELPRAPYDPKPYKMQFRKYHGVASELGAEYYYRDGQRSPLTYYHMKSPSMGDMVVVGSTDGRKIDARTIDNHVKERTRGFAVQIILEGRGVKAYWEPKKPHLMARLGVGAKVKDLTEYCTRDPDVDVSVNKKGDVVVLHGPTKERVGTLAYKLLRKMQPRLLPYTGNGGHFAFHPNRRKTIRKK